MPSRSSTRRRQTPAALQRSQELEAVIRQRVSNRLGRRVRNFAVAVECGVIHLAGQCSTFYTKQQAQHAVLGVVEDEVIDNRIEVAVLGTPSVNYSNAPCSNGR